MNFIKSNIKLLLSIFNIHLASSNSYKQGGYRVNVLNQLGIDLVLDVGANIGQYSLELMKSGYKKNIISFEPLADIYDQLVNCSKKFDNWIIYDRCAIGNENGEIVINVSENYESSSIYNVLEKSIKAEPRTKFIKKETVKIAKLSDVVKFQKSSRIHLKIDVQGYEEQVLKGAADIFKNVCSIEVEISMLPLYENALSPQILLTKLNEYGYNPVFYTTVFEDVDSGGVLQLNGLFVKNELLNLLS
jgi:FkbM family methyltransferase